MCYTKIPCNNKKYAKYTHISPFCLVLSLSVTVSRSRPNDHTRQSVSVHMGLLSDTNHTSECIVSYIYKLLSSGNVKLVYLKSLSSAYTHIGTGSIEKSPCKWNYITDIDHNVSESTSAWVHK